MNDDDVRNLVRELRRLNDAIEMLFGLRPRDADELPLVREVQGLIDDADALSRRGVWAAADNTGQVYVCVRKGFMQPPQCFEVNKVEDAMAYLSGVRKRV